MLKSLLPLVLLLGTACAADTPPAEPPPSQPPPKRRPSVLGDPLKRAKELAAEEKLQEAIDETKTVIGSTPNHAEAYLLLSSLHAVTGNGEAALQALDDGLAAIPNDPALYQARGMLRLENGDHARAVEDLETAKNGSKEPSAQLLADLAYAYIFVSRLDDALPAAKTAHEKDPKSFEAAYVLGEVLWRKQDKEGAVAAYESAVQLAPKEAMVRRRLAAGYGSLGRYGDALKIYDTLIEQSPNDPSLYAGAANALFGMEKKKQAVQRLQKAVELAPESTKYLELLLKAQREAKDRRGAKATERKLKKLRKKSGK